jgi:hypothetical protein
MPKNKTIPAHVRKAIRSANIQIPAMVELVSHFMALAGGPQVLAKMMLEEFVNARPGSAIRQRLLDSVLRMMTVASSQVGQSEEIDLIADDDLEAELQRLLKEMPDAKEEEAGGAGGPDGSPEG